MTSDWYITILNDPQGFWKLPQHYLTAPFKGSSTDTAILSEFLDTLLNHPLWLLVIVLFVLLLGGSLLVGAVVTASETRREKKEQMERHLTKHKRRRDENCLPDFIAPYESEEFDRG